LLLALPLALVSIAPAREAVTLEGHWVWDALGHDGRLAAVFTPTGEGTWDVAFHFEYQGKHIYRGTAEGSLTEGSLRGEVIDDTGERTFSFRGKFRKGRFRGTHSETTGGGRRRTGTLTLRG
jgi:hypothetical protein